MTRKQRRLIAFSFGVFLIGRGGKIWAHSCCKDGNGIAKAYRSGYGTECNDGSIDKTCVPSAPQRLHAHHLTFKKQHSDRGQVLLPGEHAPTTTLKDSK